MPRDPRLVYATMPREYKRYLYSGLYPRSWFTVVHTTTRLIDWSSVMLFKPATWYNINPNEPIGPEFESSKYPRMTSEEIENF